MEHYIENQRANIQSMSIYWVSYVLAKWRNMEQFRHSRGCFLCMRIFKDIYINLQYNINMTYVNLCGTTFNRVEEMDKGPE